MTAYNREAYISEAIESVMASTYQNWELIIVDDCSTDGTINIARKYEKEDHRISVYENEKNIGDYPNRNKAASYAKGKYLKYVDADDMIYPHGLEIIVNNMERFPGAEWGIMSQKQFNDQIFPKLLDSEEIYRMHYIHKRPILNKAPLSVVLTKELFNKEGGFKNVRHYGDAEFWHRLGLKYNLVLMQDGIVWWRGHADQESSKRSLKIDIQFESKSMIRQNINSDLCPLSKAEKNRVLNELNKKKLHYLLRLLKKGKWKLLYKYYFQKERR